MGNRDTNPTKTAPHSLRPSLESLFSPSRPDIVDPVTLAERAGCLFHPILTESVVITGPPSSGKTTSLGGFKRWGLNTHAESARLVLERAAQAGYSTAEIYSEAVKQVRQEAMMTASFIRDFKLACQDPDGRHYLDRSFLDVIPFSEVIGVDIDWARPLVNSIRFQKRVIYLEELPLVGDGERPADSDFDALRKEVDRRSRKFYVENGYELLVIPAFEQSKLLGPVDRFVDICKKLDLQPLVG